MLLTLSGKSFEAEPMDNGFSGDKKYCLTDVDGKKYLLRIMMNTPYEIGKKHFTMLKKADDVGIPMCRPIEFGLFKGSSYFLQSWIDGENLNDKISSFSEMEQYQWGIKAGNIQRKIHSIPVLGKQEDWSDCFSRKISEDVQKYYDCDLHFNGDELIIKYIEKNMHLLKNRSQCYQHGDYLLINMMVENEELRIIDFECQGYGDPWREFDRTVWSAWKSCHFATGQLHGYFLGEPPIEFFEFLIFYISCYIIKLIPWAVEYVQREMANVNVLSKDEINIVNKRTKDEIDAVMSRTQDVLFWFENMRNPVPKWYIKNDLVLLP